MRVGFLVGLRARVEETPSISGGKFRMCGISPATENCRDLTRGYSPAIRGADDDVMRLGIG